MGGRQGQRMREWIWVAQDLKRVRSQVASGEVWSTQSKVGGS